MFKQVREQNNDKPILKYLLFIIMLFIKNEFLSEVQFLHLSFVF